MYWLTAGDEPGVNLDILFRLEIRKRGRYEDNIAAQGILLFYYHGKKSLSSACILN